MFLNHIYFSFIFHFHRSNESLTLRATSLFSHTSCTQATFSWQGSRETVQAGVVARISAWLWLTLVSPRLSVRQIGYVDSSDAWLAWFGQLDYCPDPLFHLCFYIGHETVYPSLMACRVDLVGLGASTYLLHATTLCLCGPIVLTCALYTVSIPHRPPNNTLMKVRITARYCIGHWHNQ